MRRGGFDALERVERLEEAVPLVGVASGVAHFEIADAGTTELPGHRQRLDYGTHFGLAHALERARIQQEAQRHASARSSSCASASTSRAADTWPSRSAVARRRASLTVSLIVVVPSSARAAPSASSSRSIRCFATGRVYTT